jgi:aspartate kinase
MKIAKFGGTSLANAKQIKKVCDIITADPARKLVVVSAPGKRFKEDTKVTDLLIACANKYLLDGEAESELQAVISRYREIAEDFGLGESIVAEISADLRARLTSDTTNTDKYMDAMKAAGEDNSAKIVACYLQSTGVEASYVNPQEAGLIVSSEYGNAQVLPESYEVLKKLRDRSGILIFPGFFGYSEEGTIVTFSRGGSDITGSILAAAVEAELYENFTDVDSVFVANPQIIENPKEIKEITYREMRELAYAGFSVFHEEALIPAFRAGIPVCVKNTNNPSSPGTMIVAERETATSPVAGIAGNDAFSSIYLSKFLMNREIGFGRRLLQILEDEGLSYEHTPSGIDNISVILRSDQFDSAKESRVVERIKKELVVDDIVVEHNIALLMIVGEGMRRSIGVASRAAVALARAEVNIELINQGSSEVSMMFGVKAEDVNRAVQALYEELFGSKSLV